MADWSAEDLDMLRRLVADGLSASQIAARLGGRSRNGVIGKVRRLKLSLSGKSFRHTNSRSGARSSAAPESRPGRETPPQRPGRRHSTVHMQGASTERALEADAVVIFKPRAVGPTANLPALVPMGFFEAVERGRCLFFVGDRLGPSGPDMTVCGGERAFDAPPRNRYCAHHIAMSVGTGTRGEQDAERALSRMGRTK